MAETAGIRSGGGRGLRKGKKGRSEFALVLDDSGVYYVQYEYIIHTYKIHT